MRFKEGDKVKVREDLEVGQRYGEDFVPSMDSFKGMIVTIKLKSNDFYLICEANGFRWTDEMFEEIINPMPEIKDGYLLEVCINKKEVKLVTVYHDNDDELGVCGNVFWCSLEDLINDHEIFKVYGRTCNMRLLDNDTEDRELLWKADNKSKISELEKEFEEKEKELAEIERLLEGIQKRLDLLKSQA